jgi:hypothetical protein
VIRLLAMAALCVAAVCLASAILQRITGTELLARSTVVAAIAAAVAVMFQLRHMPRLAAAALEIDRQGNLRELLSSAVLAEHPDRLSACVIAAAEQKAAEVDVGQLSAGSLGTPVWIGALLIAGFLPLAYRPPATVSQKATDEIADVVTPAERRSPGAVAPSHSEQRQLLQEGQTLGASAITIAAVSDRQQQLAASRRPTKSDTAGMSAGGGLAQGATTTPPAAPPTIAPTPGDSGGTSTAAGSGSAGTSPAGTTAGVGQVAAASERTGLQPGSSAAGQGQGTIDAQSFPESYRDVLKAYFAR